MGGGWGLGGGGLRILEGRRLGESGEGGEFFLQYSCEENPPLNPDSGVAISGHPVSKIFCLIYKTSLGTFGRTLPDNSGFCLHTTQFGFRSLFLSLFVLLLPLLLLLLLLPLDDPVPVQSLSVVASASDL